MPGPDRPAVLAVLADAQRLGFLGPAPVADHASHADRFVDALRPAGLILDLGSGGGVPGLVVAAACPDATVVLLDARPRRTDYLRRAVARLGWAGRVRVLTGQAEVLGHDPAWRAHCDAVVARGFGSPGATAESGAPFLRLGGQLVVSEPPDDQDAGAERRWPEGPLAELGLRTDPGPASHREVRSFSLVAPCPARFPRAGGRRHPLF